MVRRAATLLTSPRLIWAVDSFRALWNSWSCSSARTSRRSRYFGDLSLFMGITILGYEYSLVNDRRPACGRSAILSSLTGQRKCPPPTEPNLGRHDHVDTPRRTVPESPSRPRPW